MRPMKRTSSSLKISSLPPELWREIFARLPAKTLLRFRCVCKSWCSVIDSPDFISLHLKLCPINSCNINLLILERLMKSGSIALLYKIRRRDTLRKTTQFMINSKFDMVYGTDMVNGLMLMEDNGYFVRDLMLWNPSIKKSVLLPSCPLYILPNQGGIYLGFAASCFDHKVVAFHSVDIVIGKLSIAVYSLNDNLWSVELGTITVPNWCIQRIISGYGVVYCQGTVYWRPLNGTEQDDAVLLCFEFDAEKFSFVELPDNGDKMLRFLFVLGESLAVFGISRDKSCIWVMETNVGKVGWHQCFHGDSTLDAYEFFEYFTHSSTKFLYVEKTGTFLLHRDNKLMSYNIMNHNITTHQIEHLGKHVHCLYVDTCVDSLVLSGNAQRSQS
ncbi:putative F-box protein At3g28280 [Amaranthus tricolor]|uniref:putative F-box protein At3g28280 n=1 Tax=Amaranthus tricolor TaxID=29722 RepID=UPI00258AFAA8|nr:putative F-box protein At3g28280 [Amaranthus tricolor]XP_057517756.1 putative F-box protein At3g28280 [Amaranthus tricolor]